MVTINYRLGPLGFLSIPGTNVTGNYGLLDQQAALKWIQRHIKNFGGDPNNVSLMGWSAGAASISYHLYATSSAHLFHRAILMSGTMISQWAFDADPKYCSDFILKRVEMDELDEVDNLEERLRVIPKEELYPSYDDSISKEFFGVSQDCFLPTMDGVVVADTPQEMIRTMPATIVPILIGFVATELNFNIVQTTLTLQSKNIRFPNQNAAILELISDYLDMNCSFYLGNGSLNETTFGYFSKFLTEIEMHHGVFELAKAYDINGNSQIFVYQFSQETEDSLKHGDDVKYILPKLTKDTLKRNQMTTKRMVQMWENFIKTG